MTSKPELVRLALRPVLTDGRAPQMLVTLDPLACMGGRGAYVCRSEHDKGPARDCIRRAGTRGTLQRAFRRAVSVPVELVESAS